MRVCICLWLCVSCDSKINLLSVLIPGRESAQEVSEGIFQDFVYCGITPTLLRPSWPKHSPLLGSLYAELVLCCRVPSCSLAPLPSAYLTRIAKTSLSEAECLLGQSFSCANVGWRVERWEKDCRSSLRLFDSSS